LKRGKIREFRTKLTIVNAKDSLFEISEKNRSIVEFPGEGLGMRRGMGRGACESNYRRRKVVYNNCTT
jgi:hypothetical protein